MSGRLTRGFETHSQLVREAFFEMSGFSEVFEIEIARDSEYEVLDQLP